MDLVGFALGGEFGGGEEGVAHPETCRVAEAMLMLLLLLLTNFQIQISQQLRAE